MRSKVIAFLYSHSLIWLLKIFHKVIGKSKFNVGKGNKLNYSNANLYKIKLSVTGVDNLIEISSNTNVECSNIRVKGCNNKIYFGKNSYVNGLTLSVEGNNNTFFIGDNFFICDNTYIAIIDGTKFVAGEGGMFADNIHIRTSDSHSILDIHTDERINYEQDIVLGDRVWLGHGVTILKGAVIPSDCIVGANSLVTKKFENKNTIIAGNPAKEVKSEVRWIFERVK